MTPEEQEKMRSKIMGDNQPSTSGNAFDDGQHPQPGTDPSQQKNGPTVDKNNAGDRQGNVKVEKPEGGASKDDKVGASTAADASNVDPDAPLNEVTKQIEETLKKYGGRESDIPLSDDYWALRNRAMVLRSESKNRRARGF